MYSTPNQAIGLGPVLFGPPRPAGRPALQQRRPLQQVASRPFGAYGAPSISTAYSPTTEGNGAYQQQNAYAQPLQRFQYEVPGGSGFDPSPAPQQPVDAQFAMGGNSMNRLVALAQQQRAAQQPAPQQNQGPVYGAGVPQLINAKEMALQHADPEYAIPARTQTPGAVFVGGAEKMRPTLVSRGQSGVFSPVQDGAVPQPPTEEMLARRVDWQANRDAELARRQANRQAYFGVPQASPQSGGRMGADAALSQTLGAPNAEYIPNQYALPSGPLPGFNEQQSEILRAAVSNPASVQEMMDDGKLSPADLSTLVQQLAEEAARGKTSRNSVFTDPRAASEMQKLVPAALEKLLGILPEDERKRIQDKADIAAGRQTILDKHNKDWKEKWTPMFTGKPGFVPDNGNNWWDTSM